MKTIHLSKLNKFESPRGFDPNFTKEEIEEFRKLVKETKGIKLTEDKATNFQD